MMQQQDAWYRHTWPWVLILIPFAAVLFGIVMITVTTLHPDDLVDDDYYKDGMAINQTFSLDHEATRREISVVATRLGGEQVIFLIEGATDSAVLLQFFHITDREQDASVMLVPEADQAHAYSTTGPLPVALSTPGIWYVELTGADDHWRVRKRIVTPVDSLELFADE